MTKSRAATSFRVASSAASLHTLGGLATGLVGLTRFARAQRVRAAATPEARRHAELLFVADASRTVLAGPAETRWGPLVVA